MLLFAILSVVVGIIISTKIPKHNILAQARLSVRIFCWVIIGLSYIGRIEYRRMKVRATMATQRR